MPIVDYDEIRDIMDTQIRALYAADPDKFKSEMAAGAIAQVVGGDYETIDFSTGDASINPILVGSTYAPAADRSKPEDGPDADKQNNTAQAQVIKAIVTHVNDKYDTILKPTINAAITEINNQHGSSLPLLP